MNNNPRTRGDFFYLNSLRRVLFYGDDKCTSESQVNGMVRVFDENGKFLSYDANHLTKYGASYIG
ncbi:hypothetical protein KI999_23135, partial [Escherichia marmotae]|nr:hypothetical protein [Escherichia marmotae]